MSAPYRLFIDSQSTDAVLARTDEPTGNSLTPVFAHKS